MNKYVLSLISSCLILAGSSIAFAQEMPPPPPNVLFIVREEIKPGKDAAHMEESNRFRQVLTKIKSPYMRIGMTPIAGNEHEVLYFWGMDSFATLEKMNHDLEKWATGEHKADFDAIAPGSEDLHVSQRDMIAVYREDLSYQANRNIPEMRYMSITTLRVRPGQTMNFTSAVKMYQDGLKKGNVDTHFAIFQVVSGAPAGLFLIIEPLKSLGELDSVAERNKSFREAMGPEGLKALDKIASEIFNPGDSAIYAFNPRMSYVLDSFAARDKSTPAFWNPKP